MGGSDQWGNMVNGVDLGRRVEKAELFALTAPLITTSEGKKMGKSASGAVWLNADNLPEYDYWQVQGCYASIERVRQRFCALIQFDLFTMESTKKRVMCGYGCVRVAGVACGKEVRKTRYCREFLADPLKLPWRQNPRECRLLG